MGKIELNGYHADVVADPDVGVGAFVKIGRIPQPVIFSSVE